MGSMQPEGEEGFVCAAEYYTCRTTEAGPGQGKTMLMTGLALPSTPTPAQAERRVAEELAEQVMRQAEALMAEKARVQAENSALQKERENLLERLEFMEQVGGGGAGWRGGMRGNAWPVAGSGKDVWVSGAALCLTGGTTVLLQVAALEPGGPSPAGSPVKGGAAAQGELQALRQQLQRMQQEREELLGLLEASLGGLQPGEEQRLPEATTEQQVGEVPS